MCEGSRLQRCTEQRVAAWTSLCSGATATSEWRFKAEEKLKLPTTIMMASSANFGENPDAAALGKASESRLLERGGGSVTVGSTLAIARPWFRQKPGSRPLFSRSRTSPNLAAAHGPAPVQATWQIRSHKGPRRAVRNFSLGPASGWYFHLFCRPAPGE